MANRVIMEKQQNFAMMQQQPPRLPPIGNSSQIPPEVLSRLGELEKALSELRGAKKGDSQKQRQQELDDEDEEEERPSLKRPEPTKASALSKKLPSMKKRAAAPTVEAELPPQPKAAPSARANAAPAPQQVTAPAPTARGPPPAPVLPPSTAVDHKKLTDLALKIAAEVDSNNAELGKGKEEEEEEQDVNRDEAKDRIRKLLKRADKLVPKMPLWRHRMERRFNPPKESVLRGKTLLRVIAKGIVVMFIRPHLAIRNRRVKDQMQNTRNLEKELMAITEYLCSYFGKVAKVPLSSLEHDASLDLDLRGQRGEQLRQRMLQLKVRFKGLVSALVDSELPPQRVLIKDASGAGVEGENPVMLFLIRLVDDGNYFPASYLTEGEKAILDFSDLGGTRNMLVAADGSSGHPPPTLPDGMKRCEEMMGRNKNRKVDVTRARTIMSNFILLRVLLGQVVLMPWAHGACKRPKRRVHVVVNNCRVLATTLYLGARLLDGSLPELARTYSTDNPTSAAALAAAEAQASSRRAAEMLSTASASDRSRVDSFLTNVLGVSARPNAPSADEAAAALNDVSIIQGLLDRPSNAYLEPLQTTLNFLLLPAEMAPFKTQLLEWLPEQMARVDVYVTKLLRHTLQIRADTNGSFDDDCDAQGALLEMARQDAAVPIGLDKGGRGDLQLDLSAVGGGASARSPRGSPSARAGGPSARGGGATGRPQASARRTGRPSSAQRVPGTPLRPPSPKR